MNICSSRREFLHNTICGLGVLSLGQSLIARAAFADNTSGRFSDWVGLLDQLGADLRSGLIAPKIWQQKMHDHYNQVDLKTLLDAIDFDRLASSLDFGDRGEVFVPAPFNADSGASPVLSLETRFAGVKKGRCIAPHGHDNMVSSFFTLAGEFRVRQFDLVNENQNTLLIKPTIDNIAGVGTSNSVSDTYNNIHWLEATSEDTFLFSTKLVNIDPMRPTRGRIPIDHRGVDVGGGMLRVEKISAERSREIYW